MTYSVDSFYDVIKEDFYNHPAYEFTNNELDKNLLAVLLSFDANIPHFTVLDFLGREAYMPITPFGDFIGEIEFILRDFSEKRGKELMDIAMYIGIIILEDKIATYL